MSGPTGRCFPANNVRGFTATLNVIVFIDVTCTRTLQCSGNCDAIPALCNQPENCNYTVPGGNFSFTFTFNRVGNEYLCSNIPAFNEEWTVFEGQVNRKMTTHTLTAADGTTNLDDGVCSKTVPDGVDCNQRPKFKVINNPLTRKYVREKTPSARVTKTINSQSAVCNFN